MVPAKGGPKFIKLKSSWHRRRPRKTLAVSLKHWKGRSGGGGAGGSRGGGNPLLLRCAAVLIHHCPTPPPIPPRAVLERVTVPEPPGGTVTK